MKVNISIDDVTPHPRSGVGVLQQCERLRGEFPAIKFTLFIPTAYYRTISAPPESMCAQPLLLSEYPEFCKVLRELPPENYELAYHGHFHGIPGRTNNDEFQYFSVEEASARFSTMIEEGRAAGLNFKRVFRPPAWRMSFWSFVAADAHDLKLALSPQEYAQNIYGGMQDSPSFLRRIVYYNANPPFIPLSVQDKLEVVYHACEWDKNYLGKSLADELGTFLRDNPCEFSFIEELL